MSHTEKSYNNFVRAGSLCICLGRSIAFGALLRIFREHFSLNTHAHVEAGVVVVGVGGVCGLPDPD